MRCRRLPLCRHVSACLSPSDVAEITIAAAEGPSPVGKRVLWGREELLSTYRPQPVYSSWRGGAPTDTPSQILLLLLIDASSYPLTISL